MDFFVGAPAFAGVNSTLQRHFLLILIIYNFKKGE